MDIQEIKCNNFFFILGKLFIWKYLFSVYNTFYVSTNFSVIQVNIFCSTEHTSFFQVMQSLLLLLPLLSFYYNQRPTGWPTRSTRLHTVYKVLWVNAIRKMMYVGEKWWKFYGKRADVSDAALTNADRSRGSAVVLHD